MFSATFCNPIGLFEDKTTQIPETNGFGQIFKKRLAEIPPERLDQVLLMIKVLKITTFTLVFT